MTFITTLIITKKYFSTEEIKQTVKDIETYIEHTDKLIILNLSNQEITSLQEKLKRFPNIIYISDNDEGEVYNYHKAIKCANDYNADFATIMELGYFYGEGDYLKLKRYAIKNPDISIITPTPIFSCEEEKRQDIESREILGCHLIGTMINMVYYKERGFKEKYYQTTFDYEYCLYQRSKNKKVILIINAFLKNANYRIIEKRILFWKIYTYDHDLLDIYYQTRNKHYLWDEYKLIDPKFVNLDKKEFKKEIKEMKAKDRHYKDKKAMMDRALIDYRLGITGKKR